VHFIDTFNGFAVGDSGTILKTTDGGGLPTGIYEPDNVRSSQFTVSSYPNPFYSYITLEYELKHYAIVNLSIYNRLGQQVAALVRGEQAAGRQHVRWEAEGLPAGIYYYRLTILPASPSGQADDSRLTTSGKLVKN